MRNCRKCGEEISKLTAQLNGGFCNTCFGEAARSIAREVGADRRQNRKRRRFRPRKKD